MLGNVIKLYFVIFWVLLYNVQTVMWAFCYAGHCVNLYYIIFGVVILGHCDKIAVRDLPFFS